MKTYILRTIFFIFLPFLSICCKDKKDEQAVQYLESIKKLYSNQEYLVAINKIDSFQYLFPKAFNEIKESLVLKQDIRKSHNLQIIAACDSLLNICRPRIDSLKQLFIYQKDKDDDKGIFIPKSVSNPILTSNMLRAGINEDGTLFLESVYIGNQLHNQVSVSTKDKKTAESLPINDEGFNFRFSNLGKQYEIIKVTTFHDNGLARFIFENHNSPMSVILKGKNTLSYELSSIYKKSITDSYMLSSYITKQDSLLMTKDKAEILIKYLESKIEDIHPSNN